MFGFPTRRRTSGLPSSWWTRTSCAPFGPGGVTVFNSIALIHSGQQASHPHTRAAAEAAELESMQTGEAGEQAEEPLNAVFGVTPLSQDMLRKYIVYSKSCKPKLQHMDQEKISRLYSELRKESTRGGGMPVALRHLESIIRMAEAHARLHLREYGAGASRYGLYPNTMALITSDCGAMRLPGQQMAVTASGCVSFSE